MYVPSSISGEKKNIFDECWVFNIFPAKVWAGEELKVVMVRKPIKKPGAYEL